MARLYGRAPRGERVVISRPGRRFKRVNVVAGRRDSDNKILSPHIFPWNTTAAWFRIWLEYFLLPLLKKGTIIVMDNARFHRKKEIEALVRLYGCSVAWLPKYSPDLNPIEKCWANLKNWLRLHSSLFASIQSAIVSYFNS